MGSFSPNCRWGRIDHPRFGMISSLVAKQDIHAGEEVTVNYRLPLHLAPTWFRDCWTRWHQDLGKKTLEVEEKESDRKSGREENEGKETNDEEEKQRNNDEFHSKELLEERF